jgi:iron complex outermembrane receptor protein
MVSLTGVLLAGTGTFAQQTPTGTLRVRVESGSKPVSQAEVQLGTARTTTSADGEATLQGPAGDATLIVKKAGFIEKATPVTLVAGQVTAVVVELAAQPTVTEDVIVTATRSEKRIQDDPLRVEVLGRDEIEEKLLMTPGDIAMLLSETTGLRVQVTSPALGAASLRVQGLRGRYTQLLADGLPLYGGQSGSIGLLQIPPMDLAQVEVIKGVASSLFGSSALGGVVNLVSRRPPRTAEHEVLVNQTTQGGTNGVLWLSGPIAPRWGYTFLADGDHQSQHDVDADGWADIAGFRRLSARPRVFWDNGSGRTVLLTAGTMFENRTGGTIAGRTVPGGSAFPESLRTARVDGGLVARLVTGQKIIGIRASAMTQAHTHVFGDVTERDRHATTFGEFSLTGVGGRHTWVIGGSVQSDLYRSRDVSRFDYTYWVPSLFAQDDVTLSRRVSVSASARVDHHSAFGTFVSPRVSALVRLGGGWTARVSGGAGYFAPTPLTEETEAAGLTRLAPFTLSSLKAERARSYSLDVNRTIGPVDLNLTAFGSRVTGTLTTREASGLAGEGYALVALAAPTRTAGVEVLAKVHVGIATVVASYTYTHSTEPDPVTGRRADVPLTPRHAAGLTAMWEYEGRGRVGIEAYYTGRQLLRDDPYREASVAYPYFGALAERQVGRCRFFVNVENLSDRRQTRFAPLVRPVRNFDGRWTVDAWAPLEGRVLNAGVRIRF